MSLFLNYSANTGLSINTYRAFGAYAGGIGDVVEAVSDEGPDTCCSLDISEAIGVLEDGAYWQDLSATQAALEAVHALICEFIMAYGATD